MRAAFPFFADKAAGKALTEKRFEEANVKLGAEEALNRQLKLMGATREEVLAKWTESATAESVLKRELKVNITDADAEAAVRGKVLALESKPRF